MIATDFDDTLLPKSMVISEYTKKVINSYVAAGGIFTLCTGRMFLSIRKEAERLGLHGEAISYQGALTRNVDSGKTLDMVAISPELAVEYVEFMQKFPSVIQVYVDDTMYVERLNPYTERYAKFCDIPANVAGDLRYFLSHTDKPINKVYCFVGEGLTADVRKKAAEVFGDRLLINSSKPYNVEAVDIRASKGRAVKALADIYGVDLKDVMTFGDNLNDLDLIEKGGFGVAVGNAVDELKKMADFVAPSCDEDGVAKTIERLCLQEDI